MFKKGDARMPKDYRPIAIVPVMSKLYSMTLLYRIKDTIDNQLPVEQAGFRPGMGCTDQIHALRMVAEKAQEWGSTVWAASLDVEKAFDSVEHDACL